MTIRSGARVVAMAFAWLLIARPALAGPSCTINLATSVAFGRYDPIAVNPLDTVGTIVVHCTQASASVTFSITAGNSGAFLPFRIMTSPPSATLAYNLYLDSPHSVVWGDGTGGSSVNGPISIAQDTSNTQYIYGRMPAGQSAPAGLYSDTLTLMITF